MLSIHRKIAISYLSLCVIGLFSICGAPVSAQQVTNGVKFEEKVNYGGSTANVRLSNGTVELVLATEFGPRILRYAFTSAKADQADNIFGSVPDVNVKTELGTWNIRGGHRLWHAPEGKPRSYVPDNNPVKVERDGDTVKLIQTVEPGTGVQKEIWITLDPTGSHAVVLHKLTNKGMFAVEMACWAMSVMNKGGTAILPQEPFQSHDDVLLPARPMVLWPYTNLTDPRWTIGKKYITLRQDPEVKDAQKLGILNRQGWAGYSRNGTLFFKRFGFDEDKKYPDFGCNNETYTDNGFLELETLGSLQTVQPGATITHREDWWLYKGVDMGNGEAGIAAALQPIISETAKVK